MAEITPPLFMDVSNVYSGDELGLPLRDLVSEGIITPGALAVTEKGTPDLSVNIAAGACYVLGDTNVDRQPCYRCFNDAVVNKGISPDPSNPRKVLVVAQVTDETFAGTGRKWELLAIHGTPAPAPVEPALPASALPLALIDVTAADASIVNSQITDLRVRALMGGLVDNAYRIATLLDHNNSAALTDVVNQRIGAGLLGTTKALRVTLIGDYLNNSGGNATIQLKIIFGGVTIYDDVSGAIATSASRRSVHLEFVIGNQNATNVQFMAGGMWMGGAGGATTGIGDLAGAIGSIGMGVPLASNGTVAVDTTLAQILQIQIAHDAATATRSFRRQHAIVEVL